MFRKLLLESSSSSRWLWTNSGRGRPRCKNSYVGLRRRLRGGDRLSASEKVSRHFPLPFDFNFAPGFEKVLFFEVFAGGLRKLDGSELAQLLHALGDVHGVTPQIVDEFLAPNDPGDDRPAADADAHVETSAISGVQARHDLQHVERHFGHGFRVV